MKIMKYIVKRTSLYKPNDKYKKPCEEAAYKQKIILSKSGNYINKETVWIIEFKNFNELKKFIKKYKRVVITDKYYQYDGIDDEFESTYPMPYIEIYDYYRE